MASLGLGRFVAPRLIGHRGAAALAPENTLASIRAAAESGVSWVEVGAKLSRDRVPMLMHGATLERTTTAQGPVADLTAAQLGRLDARSRFASRDASCASRNRSICLSRITSRSVIRR